MSDPVKGATSLPWTEPCRMPPRMVILLLLVCGGCNADVRSANNADMHPAKETVASRAATSSEKQNAGRAKEKLVNLYTVASATGMDWQYRNGESVGVASIVESLGGGVGMLDFDRDGLLDLCLPGGGQFVLPRTISGLPTGLLRNLGDWNFQQVAEPSRVAQAACYTHGVAAADYDNDGFTDFLITGYGQLQLFHNQGDGTFIDVMPSAGIVDHQWSSSAAWGDLNSDGNLDLYVCHYVNWSFDNHPFHPGPSPELREVSYPKDFDGLNDSLFLSNGDSTFNEASQAWGLVAGGKGLGVLIGDINADNRPDVYVANDTTDNFFYLNEGDKLLECGVSAGVARDDDGIPQGSMGVDLCDFNGDLRPDIWAANYERESFALYRNEGRGLFLHVSRSTGITALGGLFVGFGTKFTDADGDGDMDVVVANGHVIKYPKFTNRKQKPLLLIKEGARFIVGRQATDNYFEQLHEGRGLALGDLDNDGRPDIVISNTNEPVACLRSTMDRAASRPLTIQAVGRRSNRDCFGAMALIKCPQGSISALIVGGGSYLSSSDQRMTLQIPIAWEPEYFEIRWPTGKTQRWPWAEIKEPVLTIVEAAEP